MYYISIIIFFTEKHLKNKHIHYWRKSWREENWNLWTFSPWHIQQTEMRIRTVTIQLPDTWIPDSTEICSSLCPVFKWLCQNSTDHLITGQKRPAFEWLNKTSLFKNRKIFPTNQMRSKTWPFGNCTHFNPSNTGLVWFSDHYCTA